MKSFKVITVFLLAAITASAVASSPRRGKGWRGVIPLLSTRADVERLIGEPGQSATDEATFRTAHGLVQVEYATAPCKGRVPGWDVPAGTVLQIHLAPSREERFTPEEGKHVKAYDHTAGTNYVSIEEGVKYKVLPDGSVSSVSYIPSKSDSGLRCPGFPPFGGGVSQYRPYDSYGDISRADEEAHLDNFAFRLEHYAIGGH